MVSAGLGEARVPLQHAVRRLRDVLDEQGAGALGDVPERLPARRCVRVEGHRVGILTGVFGELGVGGAEGMLVERVARRELVDQPPREREVPGGKRGSQHSGQVSGVVRSLADPRCLFDLGEQCRRSLGFLEDERGGSRRSSEHDLVGGAGGVFRLLDPVGAGSPNIWTEFGEDLPNGIITDVHYTNRNNRDRLFVASLGRGVWTIVNASTFLDNPAVWNLNGTTGNDTIEIIRNAANPSLLDVFVNVPQPPVGQRRVPTHQVQASIFERICVLATTMSS